MSAWLRSVTHWYCRKCGGYIGTTIRRTQSEGGDGDDRVSLICIDCKRTER